MSDKFGDGRDPYLYPGLNIMRNCLTCAPFIASCIRMFLTGPDNCARSIYIRAIPVFAILPTSKKRATP